MARVVRTLAMMRQHCGRVSKHAVFLWCGVKLQTGLGSDAASGVGTSGPLLGLAGESFDVRDDGT